MAKIKVVLCVGTPTPDKERERQILSQLGKNDPDIEIQAVCSTFEELQAINPSRAFEVDVIFLDTISVRIPWGKPLSESLEHFKNAKVVATLLVKMLQHQAKLEDRGVAVILSAPYNVPSALRAIKDAVATRTKNAVVVQTSTRAKLIAVYGPRGGVGVSSIALSLAVALAAQAKGKDGKADVALVDFTEFADMHTLFKHDHTSNLNTLVAMLDTIDIPTLRDQIMRVDPSGVRVLYGPATPGEGRGYQEFGSKILEQLLPNFDYVVVDLSSDLNENNNPIALEVIEAAHRIVMVVGSQPYEQKLAKRRFVDFLRRASFDESRLLAVVNQADIGASGQAYEQIEERLGVAPQAHVRYDRKTIREAVNAGRPPVLAPEERPIAIDLRRLALLIELSLYYEASEK